MSREKVLVKLYDITFSPTGGTRKVSSILVNALEEASRAKTTEGETIGISRVESNHIELV